MISTTPISRWRMSDHSDELLSHKLFTLRGATHRKKIYVSFVNQMTELGNQQGKLKALFVSKASGLLIPVV